jgi:phosphoribosyl-AMP cyclohydrolase
MKLIDSIKFDERGLVPAVIQNAEDGRVLTLCYMNREAVRKTLETGKVHVFRRSQGRTMLKGESSGHIQELRTIFLDCEGNSLLIGVKQHVAGCHAGYMSCYYRRFDPETNSFKIVEERVFDPEQVYKGRP